MGVKGEESRGYQVVMSRKQLSALRAALNAYRMLCEGNLDWLVEHVDRFPPGGKALDPLARDRFVGLVRGFCRVAFWWADGPDGVNPSLHLQRAHMQTGDLLKRLPAGSHQGEPVVFEVGELELLSAVTALDLYSRIGMGQLEELSWIARAWAPMLPSPEEDEEARLAIADMKFMVWGHHPNSSWGIYNPEVPEPCRMAYDIKQVARKLLAEVREAPSWSVDYRDFMATCDEPPVKVRLLDAKP